jgi:hypothetical protein
VPGIERERGNLISTVFRSRVSAFSQSTKKELALKEPYVPFVRRPFFFLCDEKICLEKLVCTADRTYNPGAVRSLFTKPVVVAG